PQAAGRPGRGSVQPFLLRCRLADGLQRRALAGGARHCRHARDAAGSGSDPVEKAGGEDGLRPGTAAEHLPVHKPADVPAGPGARAEVATASPHTTVTGPWPVTVWRPRPASVADAAAVDLRRRPM